MARPEPYDPECCKCHDDFCAMLIRKDTNHPPHSYCKRHWPKDAGEWEKERLTAEGRRALKLKCGRCKDEPMMVSGATANWWYCKNPDCLSAIRFFS